MFDWLSQGLEEHVMKNNLKNINLYKISMTINEIYKII